MFATLEGQFLCMELIIWALVLHLPRIIATSTPFGTYKILLMCKAHHHSWVAHESLLMHCVHEALCCLEYALYIWCWRN